MAQVNFPPVVVFCQSGRTSICPTWHSYLNTLTKPFSIGCQIGICDFPVIELVFQESRSLLRPKAWLHLFFESQPHTPDGLHGKLKTYALFDFMLTLATSRRMTFDVRLKSFMSFMLIGLMSCNTLLSATGEISLYFHHDLSFHVDAAAAEKDSKLPATVAETSKHSHHHHHHQELKLSADKEPTIRGNTFDRVQAPILIATVDLFDSIFVWPATLMTGGPARRPPPPEAMSNYLSVLRTLVLRI